MTTRDALNALSNSPRRTAARFWVQMGQESFMVFVQRGSVPREKVGAMIASHEMDLPCTIRQEEVE